MRKFGGGWKREKQKKVTKRRGSRKSRGSGRKRKEDRDTTILQQYLITADQLIMIN
jgi:hypothetical protein